MTDDCVDLMIAYSGSLVTDYKGGGRLALYTLGRLEFGLLKKLQKLHWSKTMFLGTSP